MNRVIHHPRFHILGPGGIGSLCAYYFHRHNIPFTLFQRKAPPFPPTPPPKGSSQSKSPSSGTKTSHVVYPPTTLKYMNLTALDSDSAAPQCIDGIEWEPLYPIIDKELFGYDPIYNTLSRSPIHQLLVTTKTYQTVEALSKIRHRLRPWTTIVLMQNGMGVREEICESMGWTDNDWERPNFVQGVISHGAQKNGDTIVHTGKGLVWLAPVVDTVQSSHSRRTQASTSPTAKGSMSKDSLTLEAFLAQGKRTIPDVNSMLQIEETSSNDEGNLEMKIPTLVRPPSNDIRYAPYPYDSPVALSARFSDRPFSDFYTPPSSSEELLALRTRSLYETLLAFQQLSTDMSLTLIRPDQLLAIQLSKLVVNSSVNPIATLLESTNGEILENEQTLQAVKELLQESHAIMVQSPDYKALDEKLKSRFLTLEALTKTTVGIMEATKQNRCSTLQDYLNGSTQCEIDYMNGYFVKMAARNAANAQAGDKLEGQRPVEPKLNKIVVEKVKEKFATAAASRSSVEK